MASKHKEASEEERPTLRGSVTFKVSDDELIAPLPECWSAVASDDEIAQATAERL